MIELQSLFEIHNKFVKRKMGGNRINQLTERLSLRWAKEKAPELYSRYKYYKEQAKYYEDQIQAKFKSPSKNLARSINASGVHLGDFMKKHQKKLP